MISIVPNYLLTSLEQQISSDLTTPTGGNLSSWDKKGILEMSVQNVTGRATAEMDLSPHEMIRSMKNG